MSKLCPSYRCTEDAWLIGIVHADATVALTPEPVAVTRDFVDAAQAKGDAEARFRFAGPCVEADCAQWKGGRCGIPARVRKALPVAEMPADAPACGIRNDCRWFAQESYEACKLCPLVVTHAVA